MKWFSKLKPPPFLKIPSLFSDISVIIRNILLLNVMGISERIYLLIHHRYYLINDAGLVPKSTQ